jgi:alpha-N-arabinofuranosidase
MPLQRNTKLWPEITVVDPNQPVEIEVNRAGIATKSRSGQTLTTLNVHSVNTFGAPNTVTPKPISAKVQSGKLDLKLEPKSVTVMPIEQ